ncbi:RNA ligase family protein [Leisingera sp. M527]|uniref:RNA ligase family protein n=1 Tax=Leisingera sp. M527 TaxID=2867014 RepID=UPI0021A7519A|nr:RNA ligase family protein [Leisingera sp. M527]UWQ33965.1 RNA ligase family protein [Leisingera sp. M527]
MTRKYGRTFHLPQSPGAASDDKIMLDTSALLAEPEVIITEKMDGENTTVHSGGCHPRSPDARYHPSRDWMKAFAAGISPGLAQGERIVGEYLYARHAIAYEALPSYFLGFAWILNGVIQPWEETLARFAELGIVSVPVLYRGPPSGQVLRETISGMDLERQEGCVIRTARGFAETDMQRLLAKYVRADHVQTDVHWMNAEIIRNGLI